MGSIPAVIGISWALSTDQSTALGSEEWIPTGNPCRGQQASTGIGYEGPAADSGRRYHRGRGASNTAEQLACKTTG